MIKGEGPRVTRTMQLAESLNGGRSTSVRRDAEESSGGPFHETGAKNQTRTCRSDILPVKFEINGKKIFIIQLVLDLQIVLFTSC